VTESLTHLQTTIELLREQKYWLGVWQQQVQCALAVQMAACARLGHSWVKERDYDCHSPCWFEECSICGMVQRA
jgi:hypothetical protein